MKEKISFTTSDSVSIVGDYYNAEKQDAPAILLLHMMPAVKESWEEFALLLQREGFRVLAIDLRGHGESVERGGDRLDFHEFSDEEHRDSYKDVEAAVEFLRKEGSKEIALAGVSIGANLALWYQSEHLEIRAAILLSAGFDYKGIKTKPLAEKLQEEQQIYFVGARGDRRAGGDYNCGEVAEELYRLKKGKKELKVYEDFEAHGTDLFAKDPSLLKALIDWLKDIYKRT